MSMEHLFENGPMSIWIDVLWFTIVLIISPVLFLFTMAISELPVVIVRQIIRLIRMKNRSP